MTKPANAAPTSGRVRIEPDGRRGAIVSAAPGTEGAKIVVLLDNGTTVAVVASALTRPAHLATDLAAYTIGTAARARPAVRASGQQAEDLGLSEYLDALSGMQAYRQQVDQDELRLIDAAKAAGATWQQIGLALGSDADGAKQRGHRRRQALADRNDPV